MLSIFQGTKRLISILLVTLIFLISTLTVFPSSVRAEGNLVEGNFVKGDGDIVVFKCESNCGNAIPFAVGAVSGSAVTLMATGDTATLAAVAATIGNAAITAVAPLATVAATAATAPGLVPIAATAATAYVAYHSWKFFSDDHTEVTER